ncbi:MAG: PIG-L family deacetylase, partial [Proteobacteria bacterium]
RNALVLAPHTDDGELGAGGMIARMLENGTKVTYAAFSTAENSVRNGWPKDILTTEVKAATKALGIAPENLIIFNYEVRKLNFSRQDVLEDLIKLRANNYDLVLMPSLNDIHQDHSTVSQEGLRAFKGTTMLGYELIWNNLKFNTECFVPLERKHLDKKLLALSQYKSQSHRDYFSESFITSLATARGVQIGVSYAEAFEVIRLVYR